mmetsp:Transcript_144290/g.366282  ORF Transcript_144290/g.366282 Transcript_144290/m.366282 type:complete len:303 (+) Transcript_144290:220-1128(+)
MPHWLVEGPRGVGADVLRPHQGDEGNGPRVHEFAVEVLELVDVGLEDLALAIVHEGDDVDTDDNRREDGAVHDHAQPHPAQDDGLFLRPRALFKDSLLPRLHAQGDGRRQVCHQNEEQDLQRSSHDRNAGDDAEEDLHDLGNVHGHDEGHEFLDPSVDGASLLYSRDDRAEIVICQDHVRCALGHLCSLDAHCHTDVGLVERRGVVHAVSSHSRHGTLPLERLHNLELVLRLGTGEDTYARSEDIHLLVGEVAPIRSQAGAIHSSDSLVIIFRQDVNIVGNGDRGFQVVAGDHDDTDARTPC